MYPAQFTVVRYHPGLAQAAPAPAPSPAPAAPAATSAPGVAVTGPWYRTIWSEPAFVGIPVVPAVLVLGGITAAILLASSRR